MTPPAPLWRNRDYLLWFIGDTIADFGSFIRSFAMPLIALAVTGSLSAAGVIGGITSVAMAATLLPGGLLADRFSRRALLVIGHLFGAAIWTSGIGLYVAGWLNFATLAIIAALTGVRSGVFGAVSNTAIKQLVSKSQLTAAVSANQGREAALGLAAGPVGGLLIALSTIAPFIAEAIGHLVATLTTLGISKPLNPREGAGTTEPITLKSQLRGGASWLGAHRVVLWLMVIAALVNLGMNGILTTLILQLRTNGVHPGTIGLLSSAMGIGILLGAFLAPNVVKRIALGNVFVFGISWNVVWITIAAFNTTIGALIAIIALSALALPVVNSALGAYVMAIVPDEKMGAITATMGTVSLGLMPFAPLIAGIGLDYVGYLPTVMVLAALLAAAALLALTNRAFRALQLPVDD